MKQSPNPEKNEPTFPLRWLSVIMVLEMLMIGVSVWLIGYTEVKVREGMKRQVRLERLHGDILHLDEVLTMSARMAAASGNVKWEMRYLNFEPKLDSKITKVIAEAETLKLDLNELGISTTNEANSRLVALEKASFKAVRANQVERAQTLLSSDEYTQNKALYAQGLEKLLTRLDDLVGGLVDSQRSRVQTAQLTSMVGWLMLILIWVAGLRGIRRWRSTLLTTQRKLSTYQSQLEARVITMAKQLTLVEHRERQRIAGLLHDQLQQLLVASRLQLGLLPSGDLRENVNELLDQSIKLSRSLTNELNPPGLMLGGFGDGLKWQTDWVESNHGLEIETEIEPQLPDVDTETKVVAFDAIREILFNVVKHSQTNQASVSAIRLDHHRIQIQVSDQGVGFNPDIVRSADRFGLLNTIRRLELIGGRLDLDAQIGRGCRVSLMLPCVSDPAGEMRPLDVESTVASGQKILIVDDHPIVRRGLAEVFSTLPGVEIREAGGLSDVERALESFAPTVALVDLSLGRGEPSGYDITLFLKSKNPAIKVIVFTSYDDSANRQRMLQAGVSHYLIKGCPTQDLLSAVRS